MIPDRTAGGEVAGTPAPGSVLGRLNERHGEKLRYLVVGAWNTAFGYAAFLLALRFLGPPLQALSGSAFAEWASRYYYIIVQWTVWVVTVVSATAAMKYFAFRSKGRLLHQVGRAYLVYLPAQGLSSGILWLTVRVMGLTPAVGQLVTIAFATVFSYLGHKYFTFKVPLEVGEVPPEELIEG